MLHVGPAEEPDQDEHIRNLQGCRQLKSGCNARSVASAQAL